MQPINLGPGLAPDVQIVDGLVHVAYGVQTPNVLRHDVFDASGTLRGSEDIPTGFFDSFPRFDGSWLVYKRNGDWKAEARNVLTGRVVRFEAGEDDGNYGVVVNAALGVVAYQYGNAYVVELGSLADGSVTSTALRGAPDGLSRLIALDQIELRKDVRLSVPGMLWPVRRGDLVVGECPQGGIACQLDGDVLRIALAGQDTPVPSCATDGTIYAAVTGGAQGVRVLIGMHADFAAFQRADVAAPVSIPTFAFTHPVIVAPFAAAGSGLPDLYSLGVYSESSANPEADLASAAAQGKRLLLGHDALADWTLPSGLRPWDVPMIELYLTPAETLSASVARWQRQMLALCLQWPGGCGVIPMFYDQFRWSVAQMLDGLRHLSEIVNLSPMIKLIAPFAYDRANGITAHPELRAALDNLRAAGAAAGLAVLQPIGGAPGPVPPPKPVPPQTGDIMQFATLDSAKVIPYTTLKPSSQAGCVNVILPGGRVLSAHGDDRDPGSDGPWEQGQVVGQAVTYRVDGQFFTYLIVAVDRLPA